MSFICSRRFSQWSGEFAVSEINEIERHCREMTKSSSYFNFGRSSNPRPETGSQAKDWTNQMYSGRSVFGQNISKRPGQYMSFLRRLLRHHSRGTTPPRLVYEGTQSPNMSPRRAQRRRTRNQKHITTPPSSDDLYGRHDPL
jgi:hypothetical protein